MPWYPEATRRPVVRYQSGLLHVPMTPRRFVFHTAVSGAGTMFSFFNVAGRATPHFYVNDRGDIEQYIDTDYRGSACLNGNPDCIAIESSDNFGHRTQWTLEQEEACARLIAWVNKVHGIPLRQLESSRPGTTGIGWHRLGIDGNFPQPPGHLLGGRVAGGEAWSLSAGKECPFDGKITGVVRNIIPRARELSANPDGDELTPDDREFIKNQFDGLQKRINAGRVGSADRDKKIVAALDELAAAVKDTASKAQVKRTRAAIVAAIGEDGVEADKSFESSH